MSTEEFYVRLMFRSMMQSFLISKPPGPATLQARELEKLLNGNFDYIWYMDLYSLLKEKHNEFVHLCKRHKVSKVYAFGSSITEHFDPMKSDIDVIVDLDIKDPIEYGGTLLSFWDNLESLLKRRVDLLTDDSINNPYLRKSIESTKKLIYDGQGEKVFV